jgi:hypothetical protein
MTLNGVRVPCYCRKCAGASRDYRTAERHASEEAADRPLYPAALDASSVAKDDQIDNHEVPFQPEVEHKEQVPSPPCPAVHIEDMVSHVEVMPGCNEPVYESVLVGSVCVLVCVYGCT